MVDDLAAVVGGNRNNGITTSGNQRSFTGRTRGRHDGNATYPRRRTSNGTSEESVVANRPLTRHAGPKQEFMDRYNGDLKEF